MQFYVNETESAISRVNLISARLRHIIADLTGPEKDEHQGLEQAMCGPSGYLPQLSNNMGELSSQLRRAEEAVDRLEALLGLDRPSPTKAIAGGITRLDGRN